MSNDKLTKAVCSRCGESHDNGACWDTDINDLLDESRRERERFDAYLAGVADGIQLDTQISREEFREAVRDGFAEYEEDSDD